jgi:hypothetical protein
MNLSNEPHTSEPQAPFPGHPFGGLIREDRFGNPPGSNEPEPRPSGENNLAADDDGGGFDFHLGVYARF